jgi:hypothetical protein
MSRRKFIAGLGGAMMLPFIAQHSNPGAGHWLSRQQIFGWHDKPPGYIPKARKRAASSRARM